VPSFCSSAGLVVSVARIVSVASLIDLSPLFSVVWRAFLKPEKERR
jgi:hypothetical protein